MAGFDWHGGSITDETSVNSDYRNTQNVRRYLLGRCGPDFVFDRAFMAWIKDGQSKTMGDVAEEWLRLRGKA